MSKDIFNNIWMKVIFLLLCDVIIISTVSNIFLKATEPVESVFNLAFP